MGHRTDRLVKSHETFPYLDPTSGGREGDIKSHDPNPAPGELLDQRFHPAARPGPSAQFIDTFLVYGCDDHFRARHGAASPAKV